LCVSFGSSPRPSAGRWPQRVSLWPGSFRPVRFGEAGHSLRCRRGPCGARPHRLGWQSRSQDATCRCPEDPRNTTFSLAVTKSILPRCATWSRQSDPVWPKSNSSSDLRAGETGLGASQPGALHCRCRKDRTQTDSTGQTGASDHRVDTVVRIDTRCDGEPKELTGDFPRLAV
jgi:hypothetical protein